MLATKGSGGDGVCHYRREVEGKRFVVASAPQGHGVVVPPTISIDSKSEYMLLGMYYSISIDSKSYVIRRTSLLNLFSILH